MMNSRSRSRSPLRIEGREHSTSDVQEQIPDDTPINIPAHYKYKITLSNVPTNWSTIDVSKFITGTVDSNHVTENISSIYFKKSHLPNEPKVLMVNFNSKEAAEEACELLKDVEMNGLKLSPKLVPFLPRKDKKVMPSSMPIKNPSKVNFGHMGHDWNSIPKVFQGKFNKQTFGLNKQFLQNLGINPPLKSRIFVNNLSPTVDEAKLQEVFSLAGKIIGIFLVKNSDGSSKCMATITFDHPVEAVQAIAMFHNQILYGCQMNVKLDMKNNSVKIKIEGLANVGLGLGENGFPLQYVRSHIEIEQIKHDIREWMELANETNQNLNRSAYSSETASMVQADSADAFNVNPMNFSNNSSNQDVQSMLKGFMQQANLFNVFNAQNAIQSIPALLANMMNQSNQPINNQNMTNQKSNLNFSKNNTFKGISNGGTSTLPNKPAKPISAKKCFNCKMIGHLVGDCPNVKVCTMCHTVGHISTQCWSQRRNKPSKGNHSYGSSSVNPPSPIPVEVAAQMLQESHAIQNRDQTSNAASNNVCDMVVFKNLPPSISVVSLRNKMQEVGEVKFVDMTAQGKAIVRFEKAIQAEKCINLFDGSKVDGQRIQVEYV